jgi:hypothetical protein
MSGLVEFSPLALGTLPFHLSNLAAFLEHLLHEIIPGERSTRAAPILRTSGRSMIREQRSDLLFQHGDSFFKRRAGHGETPASTCSQVPKTGLEPARGV